MRLMLGERARHLACLVALGVLPATAAAQFEAVYVLGDSLSDSGNAAIAVAPLFQPVPFGGLIPSLPYESGRLSNGPVWVEYYAQQLGLAATPSLAGGTNYAFGGARTGPLGDPTALLTQFFSLMTDLGTAFPPHALYVVWGGANDLRDAAGMKLADDDLGASATLAVAVGDIASIVTGLAAGGALDVLVFNAPDLGLTPEARRGDPGLSEASTCVATEFNALLEQALSGIDAASNVRITQFDFFDLTRTIAADPESAGLVNASDPCVDLFSVCTSPDDFLFYDGIHPTTAAHASFVSPALSAQCARALESLFDRLAQTPIHGRDARWIRQRLSAQLHAAQRLLDAGQLRASGEALLRFRHAVRALSRGHHRKLHPDDAHALHAGASSVIQCLKALHAG